MMKLISLNLILVLFACHTAFAQEGDTFYERHGIPQEALGFYSMGSQTNLETWTKDTTDDYDLLAGSESTQNSKIRLSEGNIAATLLLNSIEQNDELMVSFFGDQFYSNFVSPVYTMKSAEHDPDGMLHLVAQSLSSQINPKVIEFVKNHLALQPRQQAYSGYFPIEVHTELKQRLKQNQNTFDHLAEELVWLQTKYSEPKEVSLPNSQNARDVAEACEQVMSKHNDLGFHGDLNGSAETRIGTVIMASVDELMSKRSSWLEVSRVYHDFSAEILRNPENTAVTKNFMILESVAGARSSHNANAVPSELMDEWKKSASNAKEDKQLKRVALDYSSRFQSALKLVEGNYPDEFSLIGRISNEIIGWNACAHAASGPEGLLNFSREQRDVVQENLRFVITRAVYNIGKMVSEGKSENAENVVTALKNIEKLGVKYPEAYIQARKEANLVLKDQELESFLARAAAYQIEAVLEQASKINQDAFPNETVRKAHLRALAKVSRKYELKLHDFIEEMPSEQVSSKAYFNSGFLTALIKSAEVETYLASGQLDLITDLIKIESIQLRETAYLFKVSYQNPLTGDAIKVESEVSMGEKEDSSDVQKKGSHYFVNGKPKKFPKLTTLSGETPDAKEQFDSDPEGI